VDLAEDRMEPSTAQLCSGCLPTSARRIDLVVIYKVDRLTRSLADFAKLVEIFDARGVSFVSITQHFNTTTSIGRLTSTCRGGVGERCRVAGNGGVGGSDAGGCFLSLLHRPPAVLRQGRVALVVLLREPLRRLVHRDGRASARDDRLLHLECCLLVSDRGVGGSHV
jgi:Resolvase, N terminal domain